MQFFKTCSPNFKKFFSWAEKYLEKHKKKAIISNTQSITMDGSKCGGWCDDNELVVAFKNPLFEQVFVHEFSHMQQNIENSPYWKDTSLFWKHLKRDKIAINSWDSVLDIIALERDCEKRSMRNSKNWRIFDNTVYAKNANLYLYFYHYVFLKREWKVSSGIYHPLIVREMPEKLLPISTFSSIDMNLMKLFDDCLDRKGKFYKILP